MLWFLQSLESNGQNSFVIIAVQLTFCGEGLGVDFFRLFAHMSEEPLKLTLSAGATETTLKVIQIKKHFGGFNVFFNYPIENFILHYQLLFNIVSTRGVKYDHVDNYEA